MDEGKRKALESLPRPSPIGLSQSMWTTICPFDPEVKLGGDADDRAPSYHCWNVSSGRGHDGLDRTVYRNEQARSGKTQREIRTDT